MTLSCCNVLTANLQPIPVLVYHQIEKAPPKGAPFRSLYVSLPAFSRQMGLLSLLGYRGLSMGELMPYLLGKLSGKVVGITFDDGYVNNLVNALPVLQRHRFSSTCYAVSSLAGKTNVWDKKIGIAQAALMSELQMRDWIAGGQEIGSHTHSHARLTELDCAASLAEIAKGKLELEAAVGRSIRHFCFPYGDYRSVHVDMAGHQGFDTATTTRRSRCLSGTRMLEIPRVPIFKSTSLPVFLLKIASGYEDRKSHER